MSRENMTTVPCFAVRYWTRSINIFTGDDLYFIVVGDNFQIPLFLRERGREGIVMEIDKGTKDAAPFSNFFNLYLDMIRTD